MLWKQYYAHSSNYTAGRQAPIAYIVVHYTANNGDTAVNNGSYFAQPNRSASAHYFVDETTVLQSVRDTDTAWHCGATSYIHPLCRNANSLGIEMCSERDENGQYYINEATVSNTVALVKERMEKYQIPLDHVLRHYDVTGKWCPEPFVRDTNQWNNFLRRLKGEEDMNTEEAIKVLVEKGVIQTGEYWLNASKCVTYLPELLKNMAEYVR